TASGSAAVVLTAFVAPRRDSHSGDDGWCGAGASDPILDDAWSAAVPEGHRVGAALLVREDDLVLVTELALHERRERATLLDPVALPRDGFGPVEVPSVGPGSVMHRGPRPEII